MELRIDTERQLVVVMYHYVRDVENTRFPAIKAESIGSFRRQIDFVRDRFLTPNLEECIEFLQGKWSPSRDLCLLTFDDGLMDHHDVVVEILLSAGVHGAFFLPTAAIEDHEVLAVHMNHFLLAELGTTGLREYLEKAATALEVPLPPRPEPSIVRSTYRWDDDETAALKYLVNHQLLPDTSERLLSFVFPQVLGPTDDFARDLYINWNMARSIQQTGLSVGGHSHRHKVLSSLDSSAQLADLAQSKKLLDINLGQDERGFAYPYGKPATYTSETIDHLESLGYMCAFNTAVARSGRGASRWEIPRIDPKDLEG